MALPSDQIDELRELCDSLAEAEEGGTTYVLLRCLRLPDGCNPPVLDALLCPTERDGYSSRLFYADRIVTRAPQQPNWNATPRILERNWHAFSWRTPKGQRLAQMVALHLKALR